MARKIASTEAIMTIMQEKGITNAEMSRLSQITPQTCYERLHKPNMKVNTLTSMLAPLGYKVVVVPNERRTEKGEYEIK